MEKVAHMRHDTIAIRSILTLAAVAATLAPGVMGVPAAENAKAATATKKPEPKSPQARMAEYAVAIGKSQRALAEGDVADAEKLLQSCDSDLRGWEYRYLWTGPVQARNMALGTQRRGYGRGLQPGRPADCLGKRRQDAEDLGPRRRAATP